jgi:hypothetical protein
MSSTAFTEDWRRLREIILLTEEGPIKVSMRSAEDFTRNKNRAEFGAVADVSVLQQRAPMARGALRAR